MDFYGQLIRRGLTMACFVWAVHLRTHLTASNTNLKHQQERTERKLVLGLGASALAHELRQPLGHLLLQAAAPTIGNPLPREPLRGRGAQPMGTPTRHR